MARVKGYDNRSLGKVTSVSNSGTVWYGYDDCEKCGAKCDYPCVKTYKYGKYSPLDYSKSEFCTQPHPTRKRRAFTRDELKEIERIKMDRPVPNERFSDELPNKPENCSCLWLDKLSHRMRYQVIKRQACRYLADDCAVHQNGK